MESQTLNKNKYAISYFLIGVIFEVFKENWVHETSACWGRPFISDLLAVSISIQQLSWYTCVKRKEKKNVWDLKWFWSNSSSVTRTGRYLIIRKAQDTTYTCVYQVPDFKCWISIQLDTFLTLRVNNDFYQILTYVWTLSF